MAATELLSSFHEDKEVPKLQTEIAVRAHLSEEQSAVVYKALLLLGSDAGRKFAPRYKDLVDEFQRAYFTAAGVAGKEDWRGWGMDSKFFAMERREKERFVQGVQDMIREIEAIKANCEGSDAPDNTQEEKVQRLVKEEHKTAEEEGMGKTAADWKDVPQYKVEEKEEDESCRNWQEQLAKYPLPKRTANKQHRDWTCHPDCPEELHTLILKNEGKPFFIQRTIRHVLKWDEALRERVQAVTKGCIRKDSYLVPRRVAGTFIHNILQAAAEGRKVISPDTLCSLSTDLGKRIKALMESARARGPGLDEPNNCHEKHQKEVKGAVKGPHYRPKKRRAGEATGRVHPDNRKRARVPVNDEGSVRSQQGDNEECMKGKETAGVDSLREKEIMLLKMMESMERMTKNMESSAKCTELTAKHLTELVHRMMDRSDRRDQENEVRLQEQIRGLLKACPCQQQPLHRR